MIERLRARGFTGIKRGMGLDEIFIDFTGREGLIGLDGKNGAGKTSVLDLLHPFDCLASRDGALHSHTHLRDSLKELTFTHGGRHYRTEVRIDCESRKSEGRAWIDHSPEPVVGGGISAYHKWAIQEFGSPELFFASLFCSQNSRKISDMRVGELKSLFVEFLRLERFEAWADTSKQAGNVLQAKMEGIDARIAALTTTVEGRMAVADQWGTVSQKAEFLRDDKTVMLHDLEYKRHAADTFKAAIAANALAIERRADIQKQIDRLNGELATEKAGAEKEIGELSEKWKGIQAQIHPVDVLLLKETEIRKAAGEVKGLEESAVELQGKINAATGELPDHQKRVHDLETLIAGLKQQVKDLESDPENLRLGKLVDEAERAVKEKEREIKALDYDATFLNLSETVRMLEQAAMVGDGIDATCSSTTCAAIKSVNEAKEKLPRTREALENRKKEMKAVLSAILEDIERIKGGAAGVLEEKAKRLFWIEEKDLEINGKIKTADHDLRNAQQVLASTSELLTLHRRSLAEKQAAIARQKALADRLPEITVAIQRKADLEKQLAEVTEQGKARKQAWEAKAKEIDDTLQFHLGAKAAYRIDETAELSLKVTNQCIEEIEQVKIPAVEKEIQAAREKIATLQAELSRIKQAEKELQEVRKEREALALQVSRWRYLQNACGKNGLQALEINGAAPLISSRANELLMRGYGPQMTVRIDTQDEDGREDLDIKVLSEMGMDSLKMKSGGEKIWLLQSIRLAMALLSKEKSGREWDYACFDEADGPLDREGAATGFMEMFRPFMEMGGIRQLMFITHREACLSYADHVLKFQAGKNPAWN